MRTRSSESLKNVIKISGGAVTGQVISILTLPIITRMYGVEAIGIWAVVTSCSNIIINICDLGLSNALMMCDESKISENYSIIVKLSLLLSVVCSLAIFGYYTLTNSDVGYGLTVAIFTAAYAFLFKWASICGIILNRDKQYDILMVNSSLRFLAIAVVSIGLGAIGFTRYGYFIGNTVGQLFTILHMARVLPKFKVHNHIGDYAVVLKEHQSYLRYQMPSSVAVTLRTELPNLLIGGLFGNEMLGYFSISQKLLTIPVTFLGQSLGKIFYQKTAEMRRAGYAIGKFVDKSITRGMLIAILPMSIFAAFGDAAVVLYFGPEYMVGGIISRIIAYRALFNFISTATQGMDIVLDKQQYVFYTCIVQTVFAVASVLWGYYYCESIYAASALMVVSFIIVQVIYFCFMYKVMGLRPMIYIRNTALLVSSMFFVSTGMRVATLFLLERIPGNGAEAILRLFGH